MESQGRVLNPYRVVFMGETGSILTVGESPPHLLAEQLLQPAGQRAAEGVSQLPGQVLLLQLPGQVLLHQPAVLLLCCQKELHPQL